MAPFKLKFRMGGSSRSTSQEHDPDPQVNEALLNHHSTTIGASSSTIDSADCTSLGSLGTNERKSLLPHKSNNLRLGYLNQGATQTQQSPGADAAAAATQQVPQTPPPSYEHVLEENTRLANSFDLCPAQRQLSGEAESAVGSLRNSLHRAQSLAEEDLSPCTDPDCIENIANEQQAAAGHRYANSSSSSGSHNEQRLSDPNQSGPSPDASGAGLEDIEDTEDDNDGSEATRKESIDSRELLIAANMTAPSSQEDLLDGCGSECGGGEQCCGPSTGHGQGGDFCDPLMGRGHGDCCSNDSRHCSGDGECELSQGQAPPEYSDRRSDSDSDDGGWDSTQMSGGYQQQQHQQQQQQQHHHAQQEQRSQTPEIISNKSSKEIYKDLAKQWGITCKMSDGCRCMECQSHYFDCEYDDNEHQKTDGGLGAGTPMFISEVMHGSACTIL